MAQEQLARGGYLHARSRAREKRSTESMFERNQVPTERRLRDVQANAGTRQRTFGMHSDNESQVAQLELQVHGIRGHT
jgi:hypothetical protein